MPTATIARTITNVAPMKYISIGGNVGMLLTSVLVSTGSGAGSTMKAVSAREGQ